jgi:hypothetical protein
MNGDVWVLVFACIGLVVSCTCAVLTRRWARELTDILDELEHKGPRLRS